MKLQDLKDISKDDLRLTRQLLVDAYRDENKINELPSLFKTHVTGINAQTGNQFTRIGRCISLIDFEVIHRFTNNNL